MCFRYVLLAIPMFGCSTFMDAQGKVQAKKITEAAEKLNGVKGDGLAHANQQISELVAGLKDGSIVSGDAKRIVRTIEKIAADKQVSKEEAEELNHSIKQYSKAK